MRGKFAEQNREPLATATQHGRMSAQDKAKLDGMTASFTTADETKLDSLATITSVASPLTLTGGALDIQAATAAQEGSMSAADKAILDALGTVAQTVPGANVAVAATTVVQLTSVSLVAGTWLIQGFANILQGAGAGTVDIYLRDSGGTQLPGSIDTLTIAAGGQGGLVTPLAVVTPGSTLTYSLAAFASAACTARALAAGAGGFNNGLGIRAVRLR